MSDWVGAKHYFTSALDCPSKVPMKRLHDELRATIRGRVIKAERNKIELVFSREKAGHYGYSRVKNEKEGK